MSSLRRGRSASTEQTSMLTMVKKTSPRDLQKIKVMKNGPAVATKTPSPPTKPMTGKTAKEIDKEKGIENIIKDGVLMQRNIKTGILKRISDSNGTRIEKKDKNEDKQRKAEEPRPGTSKETEEEIAIIDKPAAEDSEHESSSKDLEEAKEAEAEESNTSLYIEEEDSVLTDSSDVDYQSKKKESVANKKTASKQLIEDIVNNEDYKKAEMEAKQAAETTTSGRVKQQTVAIMKALTAIHTMMNISTKMPQELTRRAAQFMNVIQESTLELQQMITYNEAKVAAMLAKPTVQLTDLQGPRRNQQIRQNREEPAERADPSTTYARAVAATTSALIVTAREGRDQVDVSAQLKDCLPRTVETIRAKPVTGGIKLQFRDADEAIKARKILEEDEKARETLVFRTPAMRKKRIIIKNVPEEVKEEEVKGKLQRLLKMSSERREEIKFLRPIRAGNHSVHFPLTIAEPLANTLLRWGSVCLGLHDCAIRNYVTIIRCHNCQGFDHVARECRAEPICARCTGEHTSKDCKCKNEKCAVCITFNTRNMQKTAPLDVRHASYSSSCPIYRELKQIRQYELDRYNRIYTRGVDLLSGYTMIVGLKNKIVIRYRDRRDGKTKDVLLKNQDTQVRR